MHSAVVEEVEKYFICWIFIAFNNPVFVCPSGAVNILHKKSLLGAQSGISFVLLVCWTTDCHLLFRLENGGGYFFLLTWIPVVFSSDIYLRSSAETGRETYQRPVLFGVNAFCGWSIWWKVRIDVVQVLYTIRSGRRSVSRSIVVSSSSSELSRWRQIAFWNKLIVCVLIIREKILLHSSFFLSFRKKIDISFLSRCSRLFFANFLLFLLTKELLCNAITAFKY